MINQLQIFDLTLSISLLQSLQVKGQDVSSTFPNLGHLLLTFFNLYGNQLDFQFFELMPCAPGTELQFPFVTRNIYTQGFALPQFLTIYDPLKRSFITSRAFKRGGQFKKILSFAYLNAMACCNCGDETDDLSGEEDLSEEEIKEKSIKKSEKAFLDLFDPNKLSQASTCCILPKVFNLQKKI